MGYKGIELRMPTGYSDAELRRLIEQRLRLDEFTFQIEHKSLDARKKNNITWMLKIGVHASAIPDPEPEETDALTIPYKKRSKTCL